MQNEKIRILVKTKNLQLIFDYCIESKTEFTVIPRSSGDDWEIELNIKSIINAVKWGMFLKSNKIDLIENPLLINPGTINIPQNTITPTNNKKRKKITNPQIETLNIENNTEEHQNSETIKVSNQLDTNEALDLTESNEQNTLF